MQNSLFLARLLGPFFLIVGVSVALNARAFRTITNEFLANPALVFLAGLMVLPAGLAIVLTHNVWVANWPVLITLLGWLAVATGTLRLAAPKRSLDFGRRVYDKRNTIYIAAGIWIAIGAVLCFFGYVK
jgi:uncharacterized membrane protein